MMPRPLRSLTGHRASIVSAMFDLTGHRLLTLSLDKVSIRFRFTSLSI
jgi:hypothetical protein